MDGLYREAFGPTTTRNAKSTMLNAGQKELREREAFRPPAPGRSLPSPKARYRSVYFFFSSTEALVEPPSDVVKV